MDAVKRLFLVMAVVLSACGEPPNLGSPEIEAASRTLAPQDPEIAAIYARSCASCHTVAATRAPLTGDTAAWAPRMAKGMDAMLGSIVNGFGGMPPFGLCMDCSTEQFQALIEFMAAAEPAQ
jgi:cytochrome c5